MRREEPPQPDDETTMDGWGREGEDDRNTLQPAEMEWGDEAEEGERGKRRRRDVGEGAYKWAPAEKIAIVTQLSSWFRYFDNPNAGFVIIGHQT
jgi:hypothetical protein